MDLRYRVRRLSLTTDGAQDSGVRSGRDLLAAGLRWPLSAARTAAVWRLDA
jgi:hypothetical protein